MRGLWPLLGVGAMDSRHKAKVNQWFRGQTASEKAQDVYELSLEDPLARTLLCEWLLQRGFNEIRADQDLFDAIFFEVVRLSSSKRSDLNAGRIPVCFTGGIGRMLDTKRFLKRMVLVGLISTLPGYVSIVSAHGGGHGTGGSTGSGSGSSSSGSGGGGHSSSGGHSSTGMSSGHSSTGTSGRSSGNTKGAQSVTNSKGGRSASDPPTVAGTVVSNQTVSGVNFHSRDRS